MNSLKLLKPSEGEVKRYSYPGVKVQYQQSDASMTAQLTVNQLQVLLSVDIIIFMLCGNAILFL